MLATCALRWTTCGRQPVPTTVSSAILRTTSCILAPAGSERSTGFTARVVSVLPEFFTITVDSMIGPLASSTLASSTLASSALASSTLASSTLASSTLASSALASSTLASSTLASSTFASSTLASSTLASSALASSTLASSTLASSTLASSLFVIALNVTALARPETPGPVFGYQRLLLARSGWPSAVPRSESERSAFSASVVASPGALRFSTCTVTGAAGSLAVTHSVRVAEERRVTSTTMDGVAGPAPG